MVTLDAAIARQVAVTFDLTRVTWVAGLRLSSLAFRPDDGVDMGLGEI
jgi:hypothetical protein